MEVALYWHFNSGRRIPRAASFHAPAAPGLLRLPLSAGSPHACPLPALARRTSRAATIGYNVHEWADHHARYVLNSRGQRLFVQEWKPWGKAKGRVLLVHGLNDHCNKYTHVARRFVNAGYIVIAHDAHGHGRSDGFRAHASSFDHYVKDARFVLSDSTRRSLPAHRRLPTFVLGHSLGGAVAIHLARDKPPPLLRGLLLTAPAVRVYSNPILRAFAPILATLAPLLPVQRVRFDRRRRPTEPRPDPLIVRCSVRARVGYEVLKSCERIMEEAVRFRVPVFIAHSKHDRVTNVSGSVDFCNKIASRDKSVALYEGNKHDLLASSQPKVLDDMLAWADRRL